MTAPSSDSLLKQFLDSRHPRRQNLLINGDFRVDQIQGGAVVGLGPVPFFICDGWIGEADVSTITAQRVTYPTPVVDVFTHTLLWTVVLGAGAPVGSVNNIRQVLEGYAIAHLGWGATGARGVALGFWIKASLTGRYAVSIRNAALNRSYVLEITVTTSLVWEFKTIWVPGDDTGTWPTDSSPAMVVTLDTGSGANFQTAPSIWTAGNFTRDVPLMRPSTITGATIEMTGVQFLPDTLDQVYPVETYQQNLLRCLRYIPSYLGNGESWGGWAISTTEMLADFQFHVPTRIPPTGVFVSALADLDLRDQTYTIQPCTGTAFVRAGVDNALVEFQSAGAPFTAGLGGNVESNKAAFRLLFTGAELLV